VRSSELKFGIGGVFGVWGGGGGVICCYVLGRERGLGTKREKENLN
jgi:hypothetical protein